MSRCGVWSEDDHYRWQTDQTADLGYGNISIAYFDIFYFKIFELENNTLHADKINMSCGLKELDVDYKNCYC